MPPLKEPSMKMKKFAKLYVATGSKIKAYKGSYNLGGRGGKKTDFAAMTQGQAMFKHPLVQELVRQELDKVGLKEEKIAQKLNDIIDKGTTKEKLQFANPSLALDAIKEVNRMKGNYAAERKQIDKRSVDFKADLGGKNQEELMTELQKVQKEISEFQSFMRGVKDVKENTQKEKDAGIL